MSYILDALRRADAERERGAVPGLHAQRFAQDDPSDTEAQHRVRPVLWLAGGALVCVLLGGALVWQLLRADSPANRQGAVRGTVTGAASEPAVAAAPSLPAPAATRSPAPAGAPSPSPSAAAAVAPEAPVAATAARATAPSPVPPLKPAATQGAPRSAAAPAGRTPSTESPLVADAAPVPVAPRRTPAGSAERPAARDTPPPAAPSKPPSPAPRPEPVAPRVYALSELPEGIRRQLPELSIGGSIYSRDRANRFLIINGQVFYEGAEPTPGLVLEQIGLKSAVLRFKDHRYSISY